MKARLNGQKMSVSGYLDQHAVLEKGMTIRGCTEVRILTRLLALEEQRMNVDLRSPGRAQLEEEMDTTDGGAGNDPGRPDSA